MVDRSDVSRKAGEIEKRDREEVHINGESGTEER